MSSTVSSATSQGAWPRAVWAFNVEQGRIVEVQFVADPKTIARLEVLLVD